MSTIKSLIDKRANAWEQAKEIKEVANTESRDLTAEERQKWDSIVSDVESLSRQIEDEERSMRIDAVVSGASSVPSDDTPTDTPVDAEGDYRAAFDAYVRRGMSGMSGSQQEMLESRANPEVRAQGTTPDAAGGYLVPEEFNNRLIEVVKSFGGLFAEADILPTSTGAKMLWPRVEDEVEGVIVDENTQHGEEDVAFDNFSLEAFTFSSKMVRVSRQLLQDSAVNVEAVLTGLLGRRIARGLARQLVTGNGTTQPQGLLTGTTAIDTAAAGVISYKDLVALEHSIDQAYRSSAKYLLSDDAVKQLQEAEDAQGRPLWAPSIAAGIPSTINGRPYFTDTYMPAVATGATPIAYGDFKAAYVVRDVAGSEVLRLSERYADFLQFGFLGFHRFGGGVQDASAVRKLAVI